MVLTLADMDGQETFEASALGTAAEVLPCSICCVPACFTHIILPISGEGGGGTLLFCTISAAVVAATALRYPMGPADIPNNVGSDVRLQVGR